MSCGIRILGSVHGTNADDLRRKMLPHAIERFVFIDHDEDVYKRQLRYYEQKTDWSACRYGGVLWHSDIRLV